MDPVDNHGHVLQLPIVDNGAAHYHAEPEACDPNSAAVLNALVTSGSMCMPEQGDQQSFMSISHNMAMGGDRPGAMSYDTLANALQHQMAVDVLQQQQQQHMHNVNMDNESGDGGSDSMGHDAHNGDQPTSHGRSRRGGGKPKGSGPGRPLTADRRRPYPCSQCSSRFGSKMELEEHQNSHTGHKPFECDICKARFNRRSTLWNHKRIHLDTKPFSCTVCHMTFKWKNSLKCHKEMHARKNETLPPELSSDELTTTYAGATRRLQQLAKQEQQALDPYGIIKNDRPANAPIFESSKCVKVEPSDGSAEVTWPAAAAKATFGTPNKSNDTPPKRKAPKKGRNKIRPVAEIDNDQHTLGLLQTHPSIISHEGECASAAAIVATSDAGTVSVSAQFAAIDATAQHLQHQHHLSMLPQVPPNQHHDLSLIAHPGAGYLGFDAGTDYEPSVVPLSALTNGNVPGFEPHVLDQFLRQHPAVFWQAASLGKQESMAGVGSLAGYAVEEQQRQDELLPPAVSMATLQHVTSQAGNTLHGYSGYTPQYSYYPQSGTPNNNAANPGLLQDSRTHQNESIAPGQHSIMLPTVPNGTELMDGACSVLIANSRSLPANQW